MELFQRALAERATIIIVMSDRTPRMYQDYMLPLLTEDSILLVIPDPNHPVYGNAYFVYTTLNP